MGDQIGGGDRRRKTRRVHERSRVAVFDVFRAAFEERKQAAASNQEKTIAPFKVRTNSRRLGVDETTLRDHVHAHLLTLMNTIRLDASVDLAETPRISSSILNYGFRDLSDMTKDELLHSEVARSIRQSLEAHEPRLVKRSIDVTMQAVEEEVGQRVTVQVSADLIADPADIPVDYDAVVDSGSGKVVLNASRRT